jgi:anti-anti-sigma factor
MSVPVASSMQQAVVITLDDRLDLSTAPVVRQRFFDAVEAGQIFVIVDLSGVEFVDSSGLGVLVSGLKATRQAGGDLRIARPGEQVRLLLRLTTLERVLYPYPTVADARASA